MELADAIERWVDLRREDFDDEELHELADIWRRVKRNEASEIDVAQMDKDDARTIMRLFEDDERPRVASLLNDVRDWALEQPPIRTVSIGSPDAAVPPTAVPSTAVPPTAVAAPGPPPVDPAAAEAPSELTDSGLLIPQSARPDTHDDLATPDLPRLGGPDPDTPELSVDGFDDPRPGGNDLDIDVPQAPSTDVPGLGRPSIDTPIVGAPSPGVQLLNAPPPAGPAIAHDRPAGVAGGPVRPLTGTSGPLPPLAGESQRQIPMAAVAGAAGLVLLILVGWLLFRGGDDPTTDGDAVATQGEAAADTTLTSDASATVAQPTSDSEAFCALMRRYEVADPVGELTIFDPQPYIAAWNSVYSDIAAVAPAAIAATAADLSSYTTDLAQVIETTDGDFVSATLALESDGNAIDVDAADERLAAYSLSECGVVFDVGTS